MKEKLRWQYRFDNFRRSYLLLQEAVEKNQTETLDQLAKEGIIQRFEYCMELAWKTVKDYLENEGLVFPQITPKAVLKEAFACNLLSNGESWISALDARNKMSHTYDFKTFEVVIADITKKYLSCFGELYEKLFAIYQGLPDE
jgi:nucleotidyltransferase substrate binding protein (TIGR01987 family)